jgi:hypothetical protein
MNRIKPLLPFEHVMPSDALRGMIRAAADNYRTGEASPLEREKARRISS